MKGSHGDDIKCDNSRQIVIDESINFVTLKGKIRDKLKLTPDQEVARIAYRRPMRFCLL